MSIQVIGSSPSGQAIQQISLRGGGLSAEVLTWGGTLQALYLAPVPYSLVLGFDDLSSYFQSKSYIGSNVGRYANRIARGKVTIAGQDYQLDCNFLGKHLLHGGRQGVDQRVWQVLAYAEDTLTLQLTLADGEMGFPSELTVQAIYQLLEPACLRIEFIAKTKQPTLCNFAQHSYFNLDGAGSIQTHALKIAAESYLPVDAECIPSGQIATVKDTVFDFRQWRQLNWAQAAYDHNFCLGSERVPLREVAWLKGQSGVQMSLATTEPGLQLYDGRYLDHSYFPYAGLALEPQVWPDAPNHAHFPNAVLWPEQTYHQINEYRFTLG